MAHERYTNDILAVTGSDSMPNPDVGNNKNTHNVWGYDVRALFLAHDGEFSLTYAGDPNGGMGSNYLGRKVYDTVNKTIWVCTTVGTTSTAVWEDLADTIAAQVEENLLGEALAYSIAL